MTNEMIFEVGDLITSHDKESKIFRRECIVVHVDRALVGVITDGISQVVFLPYDSPSLKVTKKGFGYLDKGDKEKLGEAMKHWGFFDFVTALPNVVKKTRNKLDFDDTSKIYLKMDGFVPKELGLAWKQFMALVEMIKQTNPEVPNYVNTLLFEWMLSGAMTTLKFSSVFKQFLEQDDDEEDKK
jgi:hypothetical protein